MSYSYNYVNPNNPNDKKPHAVTQVGTAFYCYDLNGNLTRRNATSSACANGDVLAYDAENRLTSITVGANTTTYAYDGDGNRVKKVAGSTATYYVGNYYEVTNGVATKYYYFGKQRVAMRVGTNPTVYLHDDHLGSTSATSGASVSAQTYYAYGGIRATTGSVPTDFGFTGQRRDASAGLMYYGARYYDATIGRFISADTIVPSAGNPQALNRYAYGYNNPLKYTDPSGHCASESYTARGCPTWMPDPVFGFFELAADLTVMNTAYAPAEEGHPNDEASLSERVDVRWYQGIVINAYDPADYAQTLDTCTNGDCDVWRVGGAMLPFVSGGLARKIGPDLAREIYHAAREFNYRGVFFASNPALRKFTEEIWVHHAIPLETLLKRPGLFSAEELNAASNLRGIPIRLNNDLHLSKIHQLWAKFWEKFPNASREEIEKFAQKIDKDFNLWNLPFEEFLK